MIPFELAERTVFGPKAKAAFSLAKMTL
jgi:hypothetical protein